MDVTAPTLPTLLVVDDTPANLSLLSELLKDEYRIRVATSGARALELAVKSIPDLILLDVMMPGLSGYEVLERLREDPRLKLVPVIMISAVDEIESVIRCVQLGAEDYLTKPFNQTLLRARISSSLEKKRLHDAVQSQAVQLAAWNRELEQRVQEQMQQLNRLGRLKRFFSPEVAASIIEDGGEALLSTHRREVVVVFSDLRGFTAFTDRSDPEEVMNVLSEYHRAMGKLVMEYQGTLEHFEGDGMMIFFNDPIELDNPAENAIRMALAMRDQFLPLQAAWKKRAFDLGLGIGIAQGYATLGAIGFEERWEYLCIGSVTNRAARLCGEAKGDQILVDTKALASVEDFVEVEPLGDFTLKGISYPVSVFSILRWKD
jgi:adenylate cyclase